MIVVIPLGPNRPDTLRYAARSLHTFLPDTTLITVGETPTTITPDEHWPNPNTSDNPYLNTGSHLRVAADRLKDPFVWHSDDTFLLAPWTPQVHVRQHSITRHLSYFPAIPVYSDGIRRSIQLMRGQGLDPDSVPCGPTHRPMLVDPQRLTTTLDRLDAARIPGGVFKALYVAGLSPVTPSPDPKIYEGELDGLDCVSIPKEGWGNLAGKVTARLPDPSRWE